MCHLLPFFPRQLLYLLLPSGLIRTGLHSTPGSEWTLWITSTSTRTNRISTGECTVIHLSSLLTLSSVQTHLSHRCFKGIMHPKMIFYPSVTHEWKEFSPTDKYTTSSNVLQIKQQKISITCLHIAPAVSSKYMGIFWLKTWSMRCRFDTNWTAASSGLLDDTTSSVSDTREKIITLLCFLKLTSAPLTWWHAVRADYDCHLFFFNRSTNSKDIFFFHTDQTRPEPLVF